MKVRLMIGDSQGWIELEQFDQLVFANWSNGISSFPMYSNETGDIFECGFNAAESEVVAYDIIQNDFFAKKVEKISEVLIQKRIREAIEEASPDVAKLLAIAAKFKRG